MTNTKMRFSRSLLEVVAFSKNVERNRTSFCGVLFQTLMFEIILFTFPSKTKPSVYCNDNVTRLHKRRFAYQSQRATAEISTPKTVFYNGRGTSVCYDWF